MVILVLDSDGLIKLTKSGILENFLKKFDCNISNEVYEEAVIKGKERLYEDAYEIDGFVSKELLKVKKYRKIKKASEILENKIMLGEGEKSTLHLFFNLNAGAIITDDQSFLGILEKNRIPFITPSDVITRLNKLKILNKEESLNALENIKPYIKESNYLSAKKRLKKWT